MHTGNLSSRRQRAANCLSHPFSFDAGICGAGLLKKAELASLSFVEPNYLLLLAETACQKLGTRQRRTPVATAWISMNL